MSGRAGTRIVRARLVEPGQGDLLADGAQRVRDALQTGSREPRRRRVWHLGRVEVRDDCLFGRLGFEQRVKTERWADDLQEFTTDSVDWGAAAPFAIRLTDLVLVYEARKEGIRSTSFAAALRSMLRLGASGAEWSIGPVSGQRLSYASWAASVDFVTRIRVHLPRPVARDPRPEGFAGALLDAEPDWVAVEWRADGGLRIDDPLIKELIDRIETGDGAAVADGRRHDSIQCRRRWDSALGDEIVTTEVELTDEEEVDQAALLAELAEIPLQR